MVEPRAPRTRVQIAIVDDHDLFAEALELALSLAGHEVFRVPVERVAILSTGIGTPQHVLRVVILDLDLGELGDGLQFIQPLAHAGTHVVVVTADLDRMRWAECIAAGARTVLPKSGQLNGVMSVVRRIGRGLPVMRFEEREALLRAGAHDRAQRQERRARSQRLTVRERELLGELMQGHGVREIARSNFVSETTVRTQVKSVLAKLEVSSQLAAVSVARASGWRPPQR